MLPTFSTLLQASPSSSATGMSYPKRDDGGGGSSSQELHDRHVVEFASLRIHFFFTVHPTRFTLEGGISRSSNCVKMTQIGCQKLSAWKHLAGNRFCPTYTPSTAFHGALSHTLNTFSSSARATIYIHSGKSLDDVDATICVYR